MDSPVTSAAPDFSEAVVVLKRSSRTSASLARVMESVNRRPNTITVGLVLEIRGLMKSLSADAAALNTEIDRFSDLLTKMAAERN